MNISVKCPNCYRQVSKENRYCTFCGYDLAEAANFDAPAAGSPAETVPEDTGGAPRLRFRRRRRQPGPCRSANAAAAMCATIRVYPIVPSAGFRWIPPRRSMIPDGFAPAAK